MNGWSAICNVLFLRPKFKIDGFFATHLPLPILFFLFPFASIVVDLWEDDDVWTDLDKDM